MTPRRPGRLRRLRYVLLLGLLLGGPTLTGCAGSLPTPHFRPDDFVVADQWPDACALGTAGTPGAAVAGIPESGTLPDLSPLPQPKTCRWTLPKVRLTLDLLVITRDVDDAFAGYLFARNVRRDVDNLGDKAFVANEFGGGSTVYVCKGWTVFSVKADGGTGPDAVESAFSLAAAASAALSRLPVGHRS